jgi:hypothetical protein
MMVIVGVLPSRCRDVFTMEHRAWQEMGDSLELTWSETTRVGSWLVIAVATRAE